MPKRLGYSPGQQIPRARASHFTAAASWIGSKSEAALSYCRSKCGRSYLKSSGAPEVLRVRDVETPSARAGQILIRIGAAAVNPADVKWRAGMFRAHAPVGFPHILGYDVAGRRSRHRSGGVRARRPGRCDARPDDQGGICRVRRDCSSSSRENTLESRCTDCSGDPVRGSRAYRSSRTRPRRDETVLIPGATGAVGRFGLFPRGVLAPRRGRSTSHAGEARALTVQPADHRPRRGTGRCAVRSCLLTRWAARRLRAFAVISCRVD